MKPLFSSTLAAVLDRYVGMKRALGRKFDSATHALQSLGRLLVKEGFPDLNAAAFEAWCQAQDHLASGVRRIRMLEAHAFCLYRRRTEPACSCLIPGRSHPIISAFGRTYLPSRRSRAC